MLLAFRRTEPIPSGLGLPARDRAIALTAILINVAMANLDTAIANTALPTIARDLGVSEAQSIWVVSAYQIAMVATLLPAAALGEIVGLRRVSMFGLVLFTLSSLFCGLAPSLEWLVTARVLQGMSAACILGLSVAMMRVVYPRELVGSGMGLNALVVGLSFAAGPSVASLILTFESWHWLFLINVPLGLAGIAMGLHSLPPTPNGGWRYDIRAAVLCALTLGVLIFTLNAAARGAGPLVALAGLAVTVTAFLMLLRRQADSPAPVLAVDLLRRPIIALSASASFLTLVTQSLAFVALPFLLQARYGFSQVDTGFLITPWPTLVAVAAPVAGRLSDRVAAGLLGGVGLLTLASGMVLLALLPQDPSVFDVAWRMGLCGFGFGFFQSPNMRTMIMSVPPDRSGRAGGLSSVVGNLGQASGAALVAALFYFIAEHSAQTALWLGGCCALVGAGISLMRLRHDDYRSGHT